MLKAELRHSRKCCYRAKVPLDPRVQRARRSTAPGPAPFSLTGLSDRLPFDGVVRVTAPDADRER